MSLMQTYWFCASLRWAVIKIGILAVLKSIVLITLFFVNGITVVDDFIARFQHNVYYKTNMAMKSTVNWLEKDPDTILWLVQLFNFGHIFSAISAIYGALKLKKWLVLPLIFFQLSYFTHVVVGHMLIMIMLKHLVSLIALIALTIVGATYVFVVAYDCCALIAFIQVVTLVQSARYKAYYGDDPFNPKLRQPFNIPNTELGTCNTDALWAVKNTKMCLTKPRSQKLWLVEGNRHEVMSK